MTPLKITVDSGLRCPRGPLSPELIEILRTRYLHKNPMYARLRAMGRPTKGEPEILPALTLEPTQLRLTRGALHDFLDLLREHGVLYNFEDRRLRVPAPRPFVYAAPFTPDPDQVTAADALLTVKQGIVEGVCGSGKTEILLMAAARSGQRILVAVHTERLQRQWYARARARLSLAEDEIGIYSGKQKQVRPVTIVMQRTLYEAAPALGREFGCFVQDEGHHAAARTFFEGTDYLPAAYRFMGTATLKRKDGKTFLVYDLFGKVLARITDEDLLALGRIHVPTVEVVPTNFHYPYRGELSGKDEVSPAARRAYRERLKEARERGRRHGGTDSDWVGFVTAAAGDAERNALVLARVLRDHAAGRSALLLVDRREMATQWRDFLRDAHGIECGLLVGAGKEVKARDVDETLERLSARDLRVAVGTTVADEGLDVPVLDRLHLLTPTAGNRERITQQVGRVKRLAEGKTDARAYYYWDWRIPEFYEHLAKLRHTFPGAVLDREEAAKHAELAAVS